MTDSLYADGAKIGDAIGAIAKRVRVVVENVRDYVNGIQDGARVASNTNGGTCPPDDDGGSRE